MKPSIEEDANTLQFGPELTDKCQTISISELQLILQSEKDNNSVGSRLG